MGSPRANPPDRGHLTTERRNPASTDLDALDTEGVLSLINREDADVPAAVGWAIPAIARLVEDAVRTMRHGGRLIYFGAGTSGRLGVLDASECPPTYFTEPGQVVGIIAGGDSALRKSSEGAEDDPEGARGEIERLAIGPNDVVVGIAAGGTTPYVWGALRMTRLRGAVTAMVCCVDLAGAASKSRAADGAVVDHVIELHVGPEVVTGSTRMKAGTATKLALNMITTASMVRLGKVWGNLMVDLRATNDKLVDRAARILVTQGGVSRERALEFLAATGGRVKPALVMARRGVDAAEAQRLLDAHEGRLRPVVGEPRAT